MITKKSEGLPQLRNRIKELEQQLEFKNQLRFTLDDSIPKDQNGRKEYMSNVAAFYALVFKNKIPNFISLQMEELAQIGRTELGSNVIRSNINCFRIIDEWMQDCTNEHMGNLNEARQSFNEDDKIISNIKEKYVN